MSEAETLLQLTDHTVDFVSRRGRIRAVDGVSLELQRGEIFGLVGESGSGKSALALSILRLLPQSAVISQGTVLWRGQTLDEAGCKTLRGAAVSLINQEPMASLDPLMPVGKQLQEVLGLHRGLSRTAAKERAVELFELVGIPQPSFRLRQYPWEFSGGMAQRVVIAMALAPEPDLLIADEPTTALDVTIQAQVLRLISRLQRELALSVLLVSHDLGVVAGIANRIAVMYAGRLVEVSTSTHLFKAPRHPYTRGLLGASPDPFRRNDRLAPIPGSPPTFGASDFCDFRQRCSLATDECGAVPPLTRLTEDHEVACWHA